MKIEHVKKIGGTDVLRTIQLANVELINARYTDGDDYPVGTDSEAFVMRDDSGRIVSLICWRAVYDNTEGWIGFSWTHPSFRRQGLYRQLYERLCQECRDRKLSKLESFIFEGNAEMIACALALQRRPVRTVYAMTFEYVGEAN